jgi:hypothetical protein
LSDITVGKPSFPTDACQTLAVQEIDEVLELLQSTWRILGVTRAVHDVCLAWVLFKQFVVTGNSDLLSTAASHLKKMVSDGGQSAQVRACASALISACAISTLSLTAPVEIGSRFSHEGRWCVLVVRVLQR